MPALAFSRWVRLFAVLCQHARRIGPVLRHGLLLIQDSGGALVLDDVAVLDVGVGPGTGVVESAERVPVYSGDEHDKHKNDTCIIHLVPHVSVKGPF